MNKLKKGIINILLSAIMFGSYGLWSKLIGNSYNQYFQAWSRALLIIAILFISNLFHKNFVKISKKDIFIFLIICFGANLTQAPFFYAFNHLDIGIATFIFYATFTITGYFIGTIFLKEKLNKISYLSLIFGLIGLLIMSYETIFKMNITLPFLSAVIAGIGANVELSFSKKLSENIPTSQKSLIIFVSILLANLIIDQILLKNSTNFHVNLIAIYQIIYALVSLFGVHFALKGFDLVESNIATIVGLSEIIFAVIFGLIIFREIPSFYTVIGGIFILIASSLPYLNFKK